MRTIKEGDSDESAPGCFEERLPSKRSNATVHTRVSRRSQATNASVRSRATTQSKAALADNSDDAKSVQSRVTGRSRASTRSRVEVEAHPYAASPVGLMWRACDAARRAHAAAAPSAVLAAKEALLSMDVQGRTPLVLAAHCGHQDVVALLLAWRAQPDIPDKQGSTALMLAAASADRLAVQHLLGAGARVDLQNAEGLTAVELAASAELRRMLQGQSDRVAVERSLGRSSSLPALVKSPDRAAAEPPRAAACRVRLDALPPLPHAEHVEEHVRRLLKASGAPLPLGVEVAVDPITLRPRGHAYVDFSSAEKARSAAECLESEDEDEEEGE